MQTVFAVLPSKTGMPPEELLVDDLLQKFNTSPIRSLSSDQQFLSAPSLVYSGLSKSSSCAPEINDNETYDAYSEDGGSALFQRKIVTQEKNKREGCSLVVVASLVDKPNNLGGLCRTCEIFGVDTLVIADPIYAADPGFKALSMSAEKKQRIEAVRPDGLLNFLADMRKKGYTVVAAEQTTDSVALHKFSFPQKTVLLLGDEKEGVPVQLLRYVDHTVEIEQLGQTRSLNVHVSAALFIAKYVEQVLLS
ncbi:RNA methyltransferase, TrmH family [Ancylostoma caninum]|uniref:RNA methyltransferase, TrmH family n=1 Tax=Ancylostoma caninum TaxID=29170 RepID=A0A368H2N5_ANCCA|nr:RNA methyltransferase, TrmH family [Ancylostoma caninum]